MTLTCVVNSADTDGDLLLYDTVRHENGGSGYHVHHTQDEWFLCYQWRIHREGGDDVFNLKPSDSDFAPILVPHTFAKVSDGNAGMLVLFQPAESMEAFFKEMKQTWEQYS